jgi:hypothetical protein
MGHKIHQYGLTNAKMALKYTQIFHSKAFKNKQKVEFLAYKDAIWQPWSTIGPCLQYL